MADVNPTRMELMKTKERIALAKKGHRLLKQKRDALILEFFKVLKKAQDLRGELTKKITAAYESVAIAELYHSVNELQNISLSIKKQIDIDIEVKNVMGVKIPSITAQMDSTPFIKHPLYSVVGTSAKIDKAVSEFEEILQMVIRLAETETAIKRLILEIEKTKRRVNALDYILIPKLEQQKRDIAFRLDEMERDSFVSLKVIKRKLEREKTT
ncbi:V-type ATP synthase subunit D [Candidatus Micrarchaeota archaeon]|nr:V-type ATP synthase subunit D [Candidatus Micrarchaeota archaeon]